MDRKTLGNIARWVSRDKETKVVFGEGCHYNVQTKIITLPSEVTDLGALAALAGIFHEAGHGRRFNAYKANEFNMDRLVKTKLDKLIMNVVEDISIDAENMNNHPSSKIMYQELERLVIEKLDNDDFSPLMLTIIAAAGKYIYPKSSNKAKKMLDEVLGRKTDSIVDYLSRYFNECSHCMDFVANGWSIDINVEAVKKYIVKIKKVFGLIEKIDEFENEQYSTQNEDIKMGDLRKMLNDIQKSEDTLMDDPIDPEAMELEDINSRIIGKAGVGGDKLAGHKYVPDNLIEDETRKLMISTLKEKFKRTILDSDDINVDKITEYRTLNIEELFEEKKSEHKLSGKFYMVLDNSSSMSGRSLGTRKSALTMLRQAAINIMDAIEEARDSGVEITIQAYEFNDCSKPISYDEIKNLATYGGTNLTNAINRVERDIKNDVQHREKMVIIITDGKLQYDDIPNLKQFAFNNAGVKLIMIEIGDNDEQIYQMFGDASILKTEDDFKTKIHQQFINIMQD